MKNSAQTAAIDTNPRINYAVGAAWKFVNSGLFVALLGVIRAF
jgi:hypothetical protein